MREQGDRIKIIVLDSSRLRDPAAAQRGRVRLSF